MLISIFELIFHTVVTLTLGSSQTFCSGSSSSQLIEASFADVGQVIAGINFVSFLTPDMASKNDARHGIRLS